MNAHVARNEQSLVGITTQRLAKEGINGIGFALSAGDLLAVLRKFYGQQAFVSENLSAPAPEAKTPKSIEPKPNEVADPTEVGTVIVSEPPGGAIDVDGEEAGLVPATLILSTGVHTIGVTCPGHVRRTQKIKVRKGSTFTAGPVPWCNK
jgi:hypothetical protein